VSKETEINGSNCVMILRWSTHRDRIGEALMQNRFAPRINHEIIGSIQHLDLST